MILSSFFKKITLTFLFIIFIPYVTHAERIKSFRSEIIIDGRGDLAIIETIVYDFEGLNRHGIFRTIPENFRAEGSKGKISIDFLGVYDGMGRARPYTTSGTFGVAEIKIGNPDVYVSGVQTYIIKYQVKNATGFLSDVDELYWNVTGNDWEVPMEHIDVFVEFPTGVLKEDSVYLYCGERDSSSQCDTRVDLKNNSISIVGVDELRAGEGMTIDLEFDKGSFVPPTQQEKLLALADKIIPFIGALIVGILITRKRRRESDEYRKFHKNNPVGIEYDPGEVTLLEASYFHDGKFELDNIGALIVWAAIHKYIKIEEVKKETYSFTLLGDHLDHTNDFTSNQKDILKLLEELSPVGAEDQPRILFTDIFRGSSGFRDTLKSLAERTKIEKKLFKRNIKMLNSTHKKLIELGYVVSDKKKSSVSAPLGSNGRFIFVYIFLFLAVNPGIFLWIFYVPLGIFFSTLMALFAGVNLFYEESRGYTQKGLERERYIKGLYRYINMAEKDRINTLNEKALTPELYESLLPYAMIFGLEKKWTKSFSDLFEYHPDWYNSKLSTSFSVGHFTKQINTLGQTLGNVGAPRSSKSGGGGSSGGGGGGGGGGSW